MIGLDVEPIVILFFNAHSRAMIYKNINVVVLGLERIGRDPTILLVSTAYFKGTWKYAFDSSCTAPRPFHPVNGHSLNVPTMCTTGRFQHGRLHEFNASFIELPYKVNNSINFFSGTTDFANIQDRFFSLLRSC